MEIEWNDLRKSKIEAIASESGIDIEDRNKDELIEVLEAKGITPTGREGPKDKTVLYAFRRAATPEDMPERLQGAFDEYEVREEETGSGKEVIKLVLPAKAQEESND